MSEQLDKLRRMAAQSQGFANDAPMEALARTKLLVHEAHEALKLIGADEREEVLSILALGRRRVDRYEAALSKWQAENASRAALFNEHERQRLEQPIPAKI